MINDVIDINDKKTYPGELIKLFDISNLTIDLEKARKILSKYAFSCAHVFSTYDINSYKNNGIQRPLIVNNANSKDYLINPIITPASNIPTTCGIPIFLQMIPKIFDRSKTQASGKSISKYSIKPLYDKIKPGIA